jgi:hypothetical protein
MSALDKRTLARGGLMSGFGLAEVYTDLAFLHFLS